MTERERGGKRERERVKKGESVVEEKGSIRRKGRKSEERVRTERSDPTRRGQEKAWRGVQQPLEARQRYQREREQ